ncbi:MAG: hypothetical protein ACJAVV_000368 [Alphaproteobacteria bacterium]|jgi:hypothetical protein
MKYVASLFVVLFLLNGCSDGKEVVNAGKYGMMGNDTPQYNAVLFLRAIYNEKSLDKAISLSTERYGRILRGYHTNKSVQRQAFSLRLDSMVAEPVSGGSLILNERIKEAEIEMKITGQYNNDKIYELKTLSMVKVSGNWKVKGVSNTVP